MSGEELIVLVHAFDSDIYDFQERFDIARRGILDSNSRLIVLTGNPVRSKAKMGNRVCDMYETERNDPLPKIGWEAFSQRVRELCLPVAFVGAELHFDSKGIPCWGCVLEAYRQTTVNPKRIDYEKCWRW